MTDNRDLLAIFGIALAMLLVVGVTDITPLRILISLPLVLLLSGYAVLRACGITRPSLVEQIVFSIGASVAITVGGGFVLNAVSLLTPLGWALWFVAVTGVAALFGRRRPLPWDAGAISWPRIGRSQAAIFGCAAIATAGAYLLAVHEEATSRQFFFTEMWMLPRAPGKMLVGVKSDEKRPMAFDVEVTAANEQQKPQPKKVADRPGMPVSSGAGMAVNDSPFAVPKPDPAKVIALWHSVELKPGETWTRMVDVPIGRNVHKIEATLFRLPGDQIYRRVSAVPPTTGAWTPNEQSPGQPVPQLPAQPTDQVSVQPPQGSPGQPAMTDDAPGPTTTPGLTTPDSSPATGANSPSP